MKVTLFFSICLNTIFQADSPTDSKMTALGIYLLSSLIFSVTALIEFAFVVTINRIEQTKKNKLDPLTNKLQHLEKCFSSERLRCRNNVTQRRKCYANQSGRYEERTNLADFPSLNINKIDFLAFWIFLIAYCFFNVFYWVLYLLN